MNLIPRKYRWLTQIEIVGEPSPAIKAISRDLIGFLARMAEAEQRRKTFRVVKPESRDG